MRDIKFRAWDKERQKWSPYRISSVTSVDDVEIEFYDTVQGVWYTNEDIEENWVLMQYTGAIDKNGQEIYEGDIVNVNDGTYIKPVIYSEGAFFIKDLYPQEIHGEDAKVIGNIYEHPELLEGADK